MQFMVIGRRKNSLVNQVNDAKNRNRYGEKEVESEY